MLAVRDANRALKLRLPERADYTTLAGFLMDQAGRLLNAGESIEYNGCRFTVERIERRRIRRVRLDPLPTKEAVSIATSLSILGAALSAVVA